MLNPFAAPQAIESGELAADSLLGSRASRLAQIGQAFVEWEKLRVWYNLVLGSVALVGVLVADASLLLDVNSLAEMAFAAVAANACFFAGHIVDCYATWLFGRLRWIRPVVFGVGTLGSVLLVLVMIAAIAFKQFLPP